MKLKDFFSFRSPAPSEIPRISLYMDQLTGWLDDSLKNFLIGDDEKTLTKTMVNNYVKARLLAAPEKKKYNQSQLMMLTMVYHLKNVLSMEDLKLLFELDKNGHPKLEPSVWYERFTETESELSDTLFAALEGAENATENEMRQLALALAEEANLKKRAAEMILDSIKNK